MTKRDTFKKQRVFYFLIFTIFISYLSIYTFQNNSQKTTDCEQYLVSYSENINIEEYLEKKKNQYLQQQHQSEQTTTKHFLTTKYFYRYYFYKINIL